MSSTTATATAATTKVLGAEVPSEFQAIAAYEVKGELKPFKYVHAHMKPNDVCIHIAACGVCHSDLHQIHNDWGVGVFPMVPGHEVIGEVIAIGEKVSEVKLGQRVGVTPLVNTCGECHDCMRGEEQLCKKMVQSYSWPTGDSIQPYTYGGFAEHVIVNEHWVFPIPDALPSIQAAPLLCGGITVWSPFVHHKLGPKNRVGIIGVGGLGHFAIQFAVKLGCHTTGISTSSDKKDEVMNKFGAQAFLNMNDEKAVAAAAGTFDFLLSTISAEVNFDKYLDLLRSDGTICVVGLPKSIPFTPFKLILGRLNLCGSPVASNIETRRMLDFCAKHGIVAQTEERDMTPEGANQALAKVAANAARYRMVLVNRHKIPAADATPAKRAA